MESSGLPGRFLFARAHGGRVHTVRPNESQAGGRCGVQGSAGGWAPAKARCKVCGSRRRCHRRTATAWWGSAGGDSESGTCSSLGLCVADCGVQPTGMVDFVYPPEFAVFVLMTPPILKP